MVTQMITQLFASDSSEVFFFLPPNIAAAPETLEWAELKHNNRCVRLEAALRSLVLWCLGAGLCMDLPI